MFPSSCAFFSALLTNPLTLHDHVIAKWAGFLCRPTLISCSSFGVWLFLPGPSVPVYPSDLVDEVLHLVPTSVFVSHNTRI